MFDVLSLLPLFAVDLLPTSAKQQGNAPQTCKTDQCINDAAEHCALSAKEPCNQVKLKNANQSPVDGTDDGKDQCNCIHIFTSICNLAVPILPSKNENIRDNKNGGFRCKIPVLAL